MNSTTAKDVDDYISRFPTPIQAILQQVRQTIHDAAPEAKEVISYQMPAFHQKGNLVYYAAWKHHIGFYPPVSGDEELVKDAAIYADEKGNLQFPLDQPMPLELIARIVKQRIKENLERTASKGKKDEKRK